MKRASRTIAGSRSRSDARPAARRPRSAAPDVADLLVAFQSAAHRLRISWYVFGAQAVAAYGVPRTTADVDITVMLGATAARVFVASLEQAGFSLKIDDEAFIAETRVLPMKHAASGWDVDSAGLESRSCSRHGRARRPSRA